MAINPCCKYKNKSGVFKGDEKGDDLTAPGPGSDPLDVKMYNIYIALKGSTNNEQAIKVLKTLTPEERCYICRRNKDFKDGSFMSYVQADIVLGINNKELAKAFHKYLNCPQFSRNTFTPKPDNEKGELDNLNDNIVPFIKPGLADLISDKDCKFNYKSEEPSSALIDVEKEAEKENAAPPPKPEYTGDSASFKNLCDIILTETIKSYLL